MTRSSSLHTVEPADERRIVDHRREHHTAARASGLPSPQVGGLYLDSSKNRVTDETLRLLAELAEQSGLRSRIEAMFSGERINVTEDRAVLSSAYKRPPCCP